jgi:hypothetical protein
MNINDYKPDSVISTMQVTSSHEVRNLWFPLQLQNLIWRNLLNSYVPYIPTVVFQGDSLRLIFMGRKWKLHGICYGISFPLSRCAVDENDFKFCLFLWRFWTSWVIQKPAMNWENCIQTSISGKISAKSPLQYFVQFKTHQITNGHNYENNQQDATI